MASCHNRDEGNHRCGGQRKHNATRWLFPVTGLMAVLWFCLRVLPKPDRISYPCQRVAAPMAAGFVTWCLSLAGSALLLRKARHLAWRSRWLVAGVCLVGAVAAISLPPRGVLGAHRGVFIPSDPPNSPVGVARGIHPGRVVWAWNPDATSWDGATGYWSGHIDQALVSRMVADAIRPLSQSSTVAGAWDELFRHYNLTHGYGDVGYQAGEKITIKLNMVTIGDHVGHFDNPGNLPYNSPQVVYALLQQLVNESGVAASDISVFDASQLIPSTIYDYCSTGDLADVQFIDRTGGDGRVQAVRDTGESIHHADPGVPERWLPQHLTDADYVINLAHLKGHYYVGATMCGKNHFGSMWVESGSRFWPGEAIHPFINAYEWNSGPTWLDAPARPMGTYNPIVEVIGHEHLGEKTLLFLLDGLYVPVHQSASMEDSPVWQSAPFNGHWTSSIFASQDGVAVDSVGIDFLRTEPTQTYLADGSNYSTADDYLHEAAQADDPPSGTFYDPEGDGTRLQSLGVHEHWNNQISKEYTRNLGAGDGIELFAVHVFRDGFESGDTGLWTSGVR